MPDLRDLLEGAVEAPVAFDLDAVGRRVDRHRRRRRLTSVGTAVALLVILVVATNALLGASGGGNQVDTRPATDADGNPVADANATTTTVADGTATTGTGTGSDSDSDEASDGGAGSAHGAPACSAEDVTVTPGDEQLGHQGDFFLDATFATAGSAGPCAIDNEVTFTLRDPDTDEVLAVEGNPTTVRYAGTVGEGRGVASTEKVTWAGCASTAEQRDEVVLEADVDGLGTYRGSVGPLFCRETSGASIMRALDPDVPPTDLPTCTQDDIVPQPKAQGLSTVSEVYVDVRKIDYSGGRACSLDATATLTFLDPDTRQPLTEIDRRDGMVGETTRDGGNQFTVRVRGAVGSGQLGIFQDTFLGWDGCLAGVGAGERGEVLLQAEVEGFPAHEDLVDGPVCGDPGGGSVIVVAPATWEASRIP